MQGYWNQILERRIGRRRALAGTGAAAASAAFLAACGGGDDDGGGGSGVAGDSSGLLLKQTDETSKAKHGGLYVSAQTNGLVSHDPHVIGAHTQVVQRIYSQLFRLTDGVLKNTDGTPEGDLFQSWELSPDKLTLTGKLDPGAGHAERGAAQRPHLRLRRRAVLVGPLQARGNARGASRTTSAPRRPSCR